MTVLEWVLVSWGVGLVVFVWLMLRGARRRRGRPGDFSWASLVAAQDELNERRQQRRDAVRALRDRGRGGW